MYNESDILLYVSKKEFQWFALGWSNQILRYLVGSWQNIKVNDIITLTEDSGGIMQYKVINKETSKNLSDLLTGSNYINLYPISQNYKTTYYYIQNILKRQKPFIEKYDDIKLALFTIKLIKN